MCNVAFVLRRGSLESPNILELGRRRKTVKRPSVIIIRLEWYSCRKYNIVPPVAGLATSSSGLGFGLGEATNLASSQPWLDPVIILSSCLVYVLFGMTR
jgi:hypothetical protein